MLTGIVNIDARGRVGTQEVEFAKQVGVEILQVEPADPRYNYGGCETMEDFVSYTFVSEYATNDIMYTLGEIFPADVETKLVSRVKYVGPWSADHLCTIEIKFPAPQYFSWPRMNRTQEEVIKDLTKM